jgi:AraC-like DNA-binding protein
LATEQQGRAVIQNAIPGIMIPAFGETLAVAGPICDPEDLPVSQQPSRIRRHCSELGIWESVMRDPDPRLRAIVRDPYTGWTEKTSYARRPEIAHPGIVMIINFGPPLRVTDPRGSTRGVEVDSFIAGLHDSYVLTTSAAMSLGLQVNLTPLGAHRLFGLPMDTLTNGVYALEDVLGRRGRELVDQLRESRDWETRFDTLDAFITNGISAAGTLSAGVEWAWQKLIETRGRARIGALTTELGWSRQRLIHRFREQVGMPPKTLARILRFQGAVRLLGTTRQVRWTELALECGYYDQAHMIREFGEFAGRTPTEFMRASLPLMSAWAEDGEETQGSVRNGR